MSAIYLEKRNVDCKMSIENSSGVSHIPLSSNNIENYSENKNTTVKNEPRECVVCNKQCHEYFDIFESKTHELKLSLCSVLKKFSRTDFFSISIPKSMCKVCFELINELEHTELEYRKAKENFERIIKNNPLFNIELGKVKSEVENKTITFEDESHIDGGFDSEDEPLAVTKSKRKCDKGSNKQKHRRGTKNNNWTCKLCGEKGPGGPVSEEAHLNAVHRMKIDDEEYIKKEEYEEDENYQPTEIPIIKEELFDEEDDEVPDSNLEVYFLSNLLEKEGKKQKQKDGDTLRRKRGRPRKVKSETESEQKIHERKNKETSEMHPCNLCRATFRTLTRLERHKALRHDSGPPYICEVCGAHYKHRRACEIHIKMHKGISDWKCEECNKLFPSKGAMMRHNNIHTGKANYQCDLCGKSFIHTSSFKMHKLTHTGLKPHKCETCGLALMTSSHLKRHQRIHSGEKRHECNMCGKRFSERYNLLAHSKSHELPPSALTPTMRPKPFRCPFCPERFDRKFLVERHCSVEHGRAPERPPPRPRNTMAKMLKQRAAGGSIGEQVKDSPGPKDLNGLDVKLPTGIDGFKLVNYNEESSSSPQMLVRKDWCIATSRQ